MKSNKDKTEGSALKYTYHLLALKDRSAEELKQRLIKKGYDNDIIDGIMSKLKEYGYIDDNKLAEKLLKVAIREKFYGKKMIKAFLLSKGIDESIISKMQLSDEDFKESATKFVLKKQKSLEGLSKNDRNKKLIKALQCRGHDYETISKVLSLKGEYYG